MKKRHLFKAFRRPLALAILMGCPMLALSQNPIPAPFEEEPGADSTAQITPTTEEKKDSVISSKPGSIPEPESSIKADSTLKAAPVPAASADSSEIPSANSDSGSLSSDSVVMAADSSAVDTDSSQAVDSAAAASWEDAMDSTITDSLSSDSLPVQLIDSAKISDSLIIPPVENVKAPASEKTKRELAVRSSQVNTIDDMKGRYKSPKKALFMSLVLPGLGQAYVGSYWRAGMYVAIETGLAFGWRHYVVTLHDRQVKKYQKYADEHWSHGRYEDYYKDLSIQNPFDGNPEALKEVASTREEFCRSVFVESNKADGEFQTCVDFGPYESAKPYDNFSFYSSSRYERQDQSDPLSADSIGIYRRANYQDLHTFYELIGKHNEYLPGWDDAEDVIYTDSSLNGESANRDEYRKLRNRATEYSRMQAGFLGALVINHLISGLDAALTARFHNKKLYETEVHWWDRMRLESFVAFEGWYPKSFIQAYVPF